MTLSTPQTQSPAPVLVLSTGRCGSTMVSELLNLHPKVLSLSEFFSIMGQGGLTPRRPDGQAIWTLLSRQGSMTAALFSRGLAPDEMLYPYGRPGMRWRLADLPPVMSVTLPHLSDQPEALFDELEPFIRSLPAAPLADQYRTLFGHLMRRFGRQVWAERSGGSLMMAAQLLRLFPEARVVHVFRDGRDTALSMQGHHAFHVLVAAMKSARRFGMRPERQFLSAQPSLLNHLMEKLLFRFSDISRLRAETLEPADFGLLWSQMIAASRSVLGALPPDRLLNLRFEDMQRNPRAELQRLIRFIDPGFEDAAWLERAAKVPRPTRSKWPSLPPAQRAALELACRPGLLTLGYPV